MCQDVNLAQKIAVSNVGCVFAYFCGGRKNLQPILNVIQYYVETCFQRCFVVFKETHL